MTKRMHDGSEGPEDTAEDDFTVSLEHAQTEACIIVYLELRRLCVLPDDFEPPLLVLCGDTSTGKTSALHRMSGIDFPRSKDIETKFATEISLLPGDKPCIRIWIEPDSQRREGLETLRGFKAEVKTLADFPQAYKAASKCLSEANHANRLLFDDVLHIEKVGPKQLPLTIVDTPGLLNATSGKVKDHDKDTSRRIVQKYLANPRAIILAVVSAVNEIHNQGIMDIAKQADPERNRTIGIITKPDIVPRVSGEAEQWIKLAENNTDNTAFTHLKRGWHVLVNTVDGEERPLEEIAVAEEAFFNDKRFRNLNKACLGLKQLQYKAAAALNEMLIKSLPGLRTGFKQMHKQALEKEMSFGDARPDVASQRNFMFALSSNFQAIAIAAVNGNYERQFFAKLSKVESRTRLRRLRARLEALNHQYARAMWLWAATFRFKGVTSRSVEILPTSTKSKGTEYDSWKSTGGTCTYSWDQALEWVRTEMEGTRGTELPGTVNHALIAHLFKELSSGWEELTREHVEAVHDLCSQFVQELIKDMMGRESEDVADIIYEYYVLTDLDSSHGKATQRLEELASIQRRNPQTYDPALQEYVAFARQTRIEAPKSVSIRHENGMMADLDYATAANALDQANGCYIAMLKRFIDAVVTEIIEDKLVQPILDILSVSWVAKLSDDDLRDMAGEPVEVSRARAENKERLEKMQSAEDKIKKILGRMYRW